MCTFNKNVLKCIRQIISKVYLWFIRWFIKKNVPRKSVQPKLIAAHKVHEKELREFLVIYTGKVMLVAQVTTKLLPNPDLILNPDAKPEEIIESKGIVHPARYFLSYYENHKYQVEFEVKDNNILVELQSFIGKFP